MSDNTQKEISAGKYIVLCIQSILWSLVMLAVDIIFIPIAATIVTINAFVLIFTMPLAILRFVQGKSYYVRAE